MPRRHYAAIRISHCLADDCPEPAGETGECPKHLAARIRRDGLTVTPVAPRFAGPTCRVCGEPLADLDWPTCELDRNLIPDATEGLT